MNGFSHSHYSVPGMFFHHHLPTCCSPAAFDHSQLQEAGAGKGTKGQLISELNFGVFNPFFKLAFRLPDERSGDWTKENGDH